MEKYIIAMDQGTTSSRCVIYDHEGQIKGICAKEFTQIYPQPGWVEHDPMEILQTQIEVCRDAVRNAGLSWEQIAGIGITNQRETTIVWDKNTGKPVYNAIVWQCRRTADYCEELAAKVDPDLIRQKTGLLIDPYFSGTKIHWILENVPGAREQAEKGELLFGTVETWLIWNLTGGKVHVTDHSNAARTMVFNIDELTWDEDLLSLLDIPKSMMPTPVSNSEIYGTTDANIFGVEVPIAGAAGDQQAALFGQACFEENQGKMTYGTGGFMLFNTGARSLRSENGLLSTVAWTVGDQTNYALEGSIFVEGAVIQWLRDELKLLESSGQSEEVAKQVEDTGGVYLVPAFAGLGAPYWDPYARGIICGLTRGTGIAHIVRAALESMAYQALDLATVMEEDIGQSIMDFKVDGGACVNDFLMQLQADLLGKTVTRPVNVESTSLGAAALAGLAVGFWKDFAELKQLNPADRAFQPTMDQGKRDSMIQGWHQAVERAKEWSRD